jgi:glycosyltransferase involved in cell wall biosynthesis
MRLYATLDKLMLRRFDKVIGVSDFATDLLRRSGIPAEKLSTIYNGVELECFKKALPTLRSEIADTRQTLVGFVGRLVPDKGGTILLRAAQQVLAVHPDIMFAFVGEGPARTEWEGLAARLGIARKVIFAGARDDMPGVYASFDLVALPSLAESMPMCLLEAMAAGKPSIATRVGDVPRLIVSEQSGMMVEPGDVKGLASAILRVLQDRALASRLGATGRAHVAESFSAEVMARSYLSQYEQVLAIRPNRGQRQVALEASPR